MSLVCSLCRSFFFLINFKFYNFLSKLILLNDDFVLIVATVLYLNKINPNKNFNVTREISPLHWTAQNLVGRDNILVPVCKIYYCCILLWIRNLFTFFCTF